MLAISARLPPVDGPSVVADLSPIQRDVLAVAFHRQLLQVRRKALQVLVVGQHRHRLGIEEVAVPDAEKAHEHWQVARERRATEMFVNGMESSQHGAEMVRADRQHGR